MRFEIYNFISLLEVQESWVVSKSMEITINNSNYLLCIFNDKYFKNVF